MTIQAPSEQLFLSRKPTIALNCRMTFAVAGLWFLHSSQRGGGPPYGRTPSAQTKNETVYPAAPARFALSFPHRHDAHRRTDHRNRHFRPGVVSGPLRADFRGVEKNRLTPLPQADLAQAFFRVRQNTVLARLREVARRIDAGCQRGAGARHGPPFLECPAARGFRDGPSASSPSMTLACARQASRAVFGPGFIAGSRE